MPRYLSGGLRAAALAAVYFYTAELGVLLHTMRGFSTMVWLPTGIGLAALVLGGYRLWPGIAIGALLVNLRTGVPWLVAGGVTLGNLLEAVVGTYLLRRFSGEQVSFERVRDVLGLCLAALPASAISATIGLSSLWQGGIVSSAAYASTWTALWMEDVLGALIATPLLLTWLMRLPISLRLGRIAEAVLVSVLLIALNLTVFFDPLRSEITYIPFPALIWAALRFGPRGATLAIFATVLLAIWGTFLGLGPFTRETMVVSLLVLQTFGCIISVTLLLLAASVAERQRAERALRESEERYRLIFDGALDAVITIDGAGAITDWNPQAEAVFGWPRREILGKRLSDTVVPLQHREAHEQGLRRFTGTGEGPLLNRRFEITALHRDGREFPVELSILPLRSGRLFHSSAFVRDITERKQAQEALEQRAEELARSNAELERFAHVAAHDLQEPLRMVSSYVQLLARRYKGRLDADADDFIAYMVGGATRMQALLKGLSTYARVGIQRREFTLVSCEQVVEQVLGTLKVAIEEKRAVVTRTPLPEVMGDEVQLGRLFQNLIDNALKFCGPPPRVHLEAGLREKDWLFSVRDNGIGIEPQYFERIFLIFQQLHPRDQYPGMGLGLSLCKKIVESHGGRIWVESKPGMGATFYFTLPISAPAL